LRSVKLVAEMEVHNGGLEEDMLNGDDKGLEGVEDVRSIFLRPVLLFWQSRGNLKLDLVVSARIKLDWVVSTLLWSFG